MVQLIWGKNGNMVQFEVLILSAGGATGHLKYCWVLDWGCLWQIIQTY